MGGGVKWLVMLSLAPFCSLASEVVKELPRPVVLLLGPTGVGKSSFGNILLGANGTNPPFPVGHGSESFTNTVRAKTGRWLGNPANPLLSVIDTPGTGDTNSMDCEHAIETVKYLKENVGSIDVFVLMFKGTNQRFDRSMQKQLELFESIFGPQMWNNVVTEISFWKYTKDSIEEREWNQQSEELKHRDWNEVYRNKFEAVNDIPTVFIDPLFHVNSATMREKEEFTKWTAEFWNITNSKEQFSCRDLCSAPDSFFVGAPLIHSDSVVGVYEGNSTTIGCYVWTSGCYGTTLGSIDWMFDGRRIQDDSYTHMEEVTSNRFSKYIASRLTIQIDGEEQAGTYKCVNSVGSSSPVEVTIKEDGLMGPWSMWTKCSKSCVGHYERHGQQNRSRECRPAVSGGRKCSLLGPLTETRSCAGDNGLVEYCPSPASWSLWTQWDPCRQDCLRSGEDPPRHARRRFCREGENSLETCATLPGGVMEERACQVVPNLCPDSVRFGPWSVWSECSQECIGPDYATVGGRSRNRTCEGPGCQGYPSVEQESCNLHKCPEDGSWQQWLSWTPCSRTCGAGRQRRQRFCTEPRYGGQECEGLNRESQECNHGDCADEELYKIRVLTEAMNHPDLEVPLSEDPSFIVEMEAAVKYSARTPNGEKWKTPADRLAFYEDVHKIIPDLLKSGSTRKKRSIDPDKGLTYYKENMEDTLFKMNKMADDLDDAAKKFGISQTVEGSVGITAGVLGGLGLILAPFTAGASLGLTVAGTVLGVASGVQGLVRCLVEEYGYNQPYLKSFEKQSRKALYQTKFMSEFVDGYTASLKDAEEFVDSDRFAELMVKLTQSGTRTATNLVGITKLANAVKGARAYQIGRGIWKFVKIQKIDFAMTFAARGLEVPKWLTRVVTGERVSEARMIITSGTKTAKALSGLGSIINIGFGIWDTINGANKIKNGSKLSDEFRKVIDPLKRAKDEILRHMKLVNRVYT